MVPVAQFTLDPHAFL